MARGDIVAYNARLTQEERKANASRAGKASAEAKRQYQTMRECLKVIATLDVQSDEMKTRLTQLGLKPTMQNALTLQAYMGACDGNVDSMRFVRDTIGEKPTEAYNVGISGKPIESLDLSKLSDRELEELADE